MFRSVFVVCCIYATLTLYMARALTDEQIAEIHKEFQEIAMECLKDNSITEEDINNIRTNVGPADGPNSRCFMACFQKKVGIMDDEGMLDAAAPAKMNKYLYDDVDEIKKIQDYLDICLATVNSKPVTDGKKGCDRALLAFNCKMNHSIKFIIDE